ncbi:uncharacterized protein LOC62_03G003898 [Vanrija pseudolonga]|uniref:F-box domain-containing protein n=1 Tax=Vanrija pseudolonga TaxID=143232 RepID=A0AAF0Y9C9_9TREE|nr:hypothetical protein LOC62_03G003898 [Vanrija pseudolonga]
MTSIDPTEALAAQVGRLALTTAPSPAIDHAFLPHVFDKIFQHLPRASLLALRPTSRAMFARVNTQFFTHVAIRASRSLRPVIVPGRFGLAIWLKTFLLVDLEGQRLPISPFVPSTYDTASTNTDWLDTLVPMGPARRQALLDLIRIVEYPEELPSCVPVELAVSRTCRVVKRDRAVQ